MSRIIRLESENIKRIKAVAIEPGENRVIVVGGLNGQGKSSLLDSIQMTLGGGGTIPSKPIRIGEEEAIVVIELDDIIVRRRFTESGRPSLVVTNKEGSRFSSPQAMLDKLIGDLSFDPLAFTRIRQDEKAELLRRLAGIDVSELESEREYVYGERRDANRDLKKAEAVLDAMPRHEELGVEPVSVEDLLKQLKEAEDHNESIREEERRVNAIAETLSSKESLAEQLEKRAKQLEVMLKAAKADLKKAKAEAEKLQGEWEQASRSLRSRAFRNTGEIRGAISESERTNLRIKDNAERLKQEEIVGTLAAAADNFDRQLKEIDTKIRHAFDEAKFPVAGLGVVDGVVLYNGIPFDQCSSAEQLRISVGMGMAMNPDLRVLLVRDGSLMDDDSMAMIAEMADEHDFQVFVERVCDSDGECSVLIEDGMVRGGKLAAQEVGS